MIGIGISESDQAVGRRSILPARPGRINSDSRVGAWLISGRARALSTRTVKSPSRSARPVRFAVVGLGHIAQAAVLPAFKHARPHVELTALVSDTPAKLKKLGRRYGVKELCSYDDARDLFRAARSTPSTSRCLTPCTRPGRSARPSGPACALRKTAGDDRAGLRTHDRSLRAQRRAPDDRLPAAFRTLQSRSRGDRAQASASAKRATSTRSSPCR